MTEEIKPGTAVTDIMKALDDQKEEERQKGAKTREPESTFIDPFNILNYTGPKAKPGSISYALLRYMAAVPAIAAIINTRLNQVTNFTRRPKSDRDTGFRITSKKVEKKMSDDEQAYAHELEDFFLNTGWLPNRRRKDNFNTLMRKWTRDSLTLDEIAGEVVPGLNARKFPIAEVYAVDAATIEVVLPPTEEGATVYEPVTPKGQKMAPQDIAYVQRIQGQIKAEYSEDELIRAHRNPRTDIDYAYFGYSELEQLITVVTAMMNALHYNTSYFNNSNLPQGVLEIVGKYKPEHLEGFKRAWQTLVSGSVGKQWKVPVMAMEEGQGLKFTPFKNSNRDMEYGQFMEFLHNIACSVYQIDPREVGFKAFDSSTSKTMDSDAPATQIENSKDKGFYPLMQFFADVFNKEIMERIAPDFRFEWVGLDEDRAQQEWAMEKDQLAAGVLTVGMYWDKHDIEVPDYAQGQQWAQLPANQVLAGYITGQQQQQAQADQTKQQQQGQMDMQEQQHNQNLESTFVQGLHQSAQQQAQAKQQQDLQDQQHGQNLEHTFIQGQHQAGLEGMKQQGAQSMAELQHGHSLEQQTAQGIQQAGLQSANNQHQAQMAEADRDHTIMQQAQQHIQALEQLFAQGMQQSGLQGQKDQAAATMADKQHTNAKEMQGIQSQAQLNQMGQQHNNAKEMQGLQHQQTLKQKFADEQYKRAGEGRSAKNQETQAQAGHERQKDMTKLQHVLTLRQKFADAGHSRGLAAQQAKYQQASQERTLQAKQATKAPDKKKGRLSKSLEADDTLVIEIELL